MGLSMQIKQLRLSVVRVLRIELLRKLRRSVVREGSLMKLLLYSIIQSIANHRPEMLLLVLTHTVHCYCPCYSYCYGQY
jgi:hypothetical protein